MAINPTSAANAYQSAAQLVKSQIPQPKRAEQSMPNFAEMVKGAVGEVVNTGRMADEQALAVAQGKANMIDVVTAVAETELAMETLVSVRDRVIAAYEEIMRMPI